MFARRSSIITSLSKLVSVKIKPYTIIYSSFFTSVLLDRQFRSPIKFSPQRKAFEKAGDDVEEKLEESEIGKDDDSEIDTLLNRNILRPDSGHQVFIIQPVIKWGPNKKRNTTPQLQLLESVTLIKTLRQWKVVGETIITVESFRKKSFFGKGNLQNLKEMVDKNTHISAIFLSVNTLSLIQQVTLQEIFGVPVYDRYTIIMHIFREHAQSREAKLQIQLAELPYLWSVLKGMNIGVGNKFGGSGKFLGGDGPKLLTYRKELFRNREAKLKKQLLDLREHRHMNRSIRQKKEIPVVAVVGYTNAGKTSLIKVLTGKESLEPQDYLFATLDVTCHIGKLPSNLNVYYVDTLGFFSDIPTYLIESFVSTLEDAVLADVIVHVRDISHPDTVAQNDNVISTLKGLNLTETAFNNIITVGNKIDLMPDSEFKNFKNSNMILVSCSKLTGIDILRLEIEKKILQMSGRNRITMRVKSGSEEYDWIHSHATVIEEEPDSKDSQSMLVKIIISDSALAKFKHYFIYNYKNR